MTPLSLSRNQFLSSIGTTSSFHMIFVTVAPGSVTAPAPTAYHFILKSLIYYLFIYLFILVFRQVHLLDSVLQVNNNNNNTYTEVLGTENNQEYEIQRNINICYRGT